MNVDHKEVVIIALRELKQNMFPISKNISKIMESISQEIETMKSNEWNRNSNIKFWNKNGINLRPKKIKRTKNPIQYKKEER